VDTLTFISRLSGYSSKVFIVRDSLLSESVPTGNTCLGCHVDNGLDQPAAELGEYLHITLKRVTGQ
jgi:hypothetical protein